MPKSVLINGLSARRGGGKTYLYNLLSCLPSQYESDDILLLLPTSFSLGSGTIHPTIRVRQVDTDNPLYRIFYEFFWIPLLLRKLRPEVYFSPGGLLLGMTSGPWKSVTMFRNMIPFDVVERKKYPIGYMRFRNWLLSKLLLKSMMKADLMIFISKFACSVIRALEPNGIQNFAIIPHGVGQNFHELGINTPNKEEFIPKEEYIFYPSIIDVYKSQYEVVDAIADLKQRGVEVPQVLLAGELYGAYGAKIQKKIDALGLASDVRLLGPIPYEQMPSFYKHAEFVLFASKSENCPNILLEALASGCAVACSNIMPMPEFAQDAAVYFDPAAPRDIARAIEELVQDPVKRASLKSKSKRVAKRYSWEQSASQTWHALFE